jgi:anaerobic selenocysteine-containing dehydrogenase
MANTKKHYRVCNLCEAMCGLEIEHDGKQVRTVKGDSKDPFSKGSLCPKGALIHKIHEDPDRLKTPLRKKENGEWEEISWTKAYDIVGEKINEVRKKYGNDAVALYYGNPTVHNFGMMLYSGEMRKSIRTKNFFSPTTMDQLPHHFIGYHMFGHGLNMPIPDIDRTDYFIMFGANPIASNGSIMSGCGPNEKIKAIQNRGGKVILFDPRATETSRVVDEHYFIKPSTDVFFLLGMLHLIQKNNWIRLGHLKNHILGLEKLNNIAEEFTPEKVEILTGVSAEILIRLTKEYVLQERAVMYGRMGISTQEHGGLCHWLTSVLNILTNHFDKDGGVMFPKPAVDIKRKKKWHLSHGRWHSRVRKLPEFDGELPVSTLAEEMLIEGEGQIKALITFAGNPALSTPNAKRLEEALPNLDFMVSIDIFLNETTKHADIILPPPSHLEIDHYDLIFNHFAVSNNAKFSPRLFAPKDGQQYDWQIAKELTLRFSKISNYKLPFPFRYFNPRQLLNLALLTGPYGKWSSPSKWFTGLSLKKLVDSKHGINFGGMKPRIPEVLNTKDGKIQIAADVFLEGLSDLKSILPQVRKQRPLNEFQLIGRRHLRSNNSWMHNVEELVRGKNRCTAMMNTVDASSLNLENGELIFIQSSTGKIEIPLETTDHIMSGVISIPHGFGHNKKGTQLSVASKGHHAGVSVNDITDQNRLDKVTGNAAFSGQPIIVLKNKTD